MHSDMMHYEASNAGGLGWSHTNIPLSCIGFTGQRPRVRDYEIKYRAMKYGALTYFHTI